MMRLAFSNFKSSFRNYLSLIISLAFTILVFLNFQNIIYTNMFESLGEHNSDYIEIIVRVISVVLGCFMFFFIWYSTNVFLKKRKKEIGTYVFMGFTNQRIGRLYMIETTMIGFSALALGIGVGMAVTYLFQMILLAISEISVDMKFVFNLQPILVTAGVFLVMYILFVIKGYINIVRSSVLNLMSAAKQNEYVRQNRLLLIFKAIIGSGALGYGFYLATKEGGQEVMGNVTAAVVLVIAGVYLLFGGLIPFVFQGLAKNKRFLYRKQRTLWVNNIIFRMKKNYRTYAIVTVLGLCSITALATSFAMKYRYDNIVNFRNTYTFQLLSEKEDLDGQARNAIEECNTIEFSTQTPMIGLDDKIVNSREYLGKYGIVPYSKIKGLASDAGLEFDFPEPKDDEVIKAGHLYLLSMITDKSNIEVEINGKTYSQIAETSAPYLGYLQEQLEFYIVNDTEYEKLLPLGQQFYTYNYRVSDLDKFEETKDALDKVINADESYTGRVAVDPKSSDIDWIKVLYSLGVFMFLVFVLASGSVMFMRLYNDAYEEKERCQILRKTGYSGGVLKKSIACELGTAYGLPLVVMSVSSYFSVHALENMMYTSLISINIASVAIVLLVFLVCYILSLGIYWKIV